MLRVAVPGAMSRRKARCECLDVAHHSQLPVRKISVTTSQSVRSPKIEPYSENEFENQTEYVVYIADTIEGLSHELAQLPRADLHNMIVERVFAVTAP
jgi:hypothetical protein